MTPTELNDLCVRKLGAAGLRDKKYVAVVGAGPSLAFIPSVDNLIAEMAKACGVAHRIDQPTWEFFEAAFANNEQEYCRVIRNSLGMTPYWDSRVYAQIVAMPFISFVTFNYEDQLPHAFRAKYQKDYSQRFSAYPIRPNKGWADPSDFFEQHLVAIHGYRDKNDDDWPKKIILKFSDYRDHYISDHTGRPLFYWWKQLLTSYPCLFIGTSLREPGIESVVKFLMRQQNPKFLKLEHLHLAPVSPITNQNGQASADPQYPPADKTFGCIDKIQYDKIDARYTGLLKILEVFSGLPFEDPEPGMPAPEPITLTNQSEF